MMRSSHSMTLRECMPVLDAGPHELGPADQPDELPGHPVVEAVGGLELRLVVDEGMDALARQGPAHAGRRQAPRLVAVGDALAVEGVDRCRPRRR